MPLPLPHSFPLFFHSPWSPHPRASSVSDSLRDARASLARPHHCCSGATHFWQMFVAAMPNAALLPSSQLSTDSWSISFLAHTFKYERNLSFSLKWILQQLCDVQTRPLITREALTKQRFTPHSADKSCTTQGFLVSRLAATKYLKRRNCHRAKWAKSQHHR